MKFSSLHSCICFTVICNLAHHVLAFSPHTSSLLQRPLSTALFSGKGFGKSAPTNTDPRNAALEPVLEWSTANSISRGKGITVSSNPKNVGGGVGVRINRNDKANSEVMRIPKEMVLSSRELMFDLSEDAVDSIMKSLKEDGLETYSPEFFLMLRLLECTLDSEWKPWVDSLPKTFDMGIYFDDFERSYLPQLAAKLLDLQERQLASFRKAYSVLADKDERFATLLSSNDDNKDIIKWAFSIVFTRSWRSLSHAEDARIVPIADCFNHGDTANVLVQEPDGPYGDTQVILKTDVERDTELLLSYGPGHDPSRFLIIFGFFDDTVQEVFCGVAINDPSEELIELGCNDRGKMVYRADGAIANTVWDTVLYATLAQKPEEQREFYEAHASGNAKEFQALHRKYRLEVAAALRNHADQVIATEYRLPTDEEFAGVNVEEHPRLSLILRHNRFMRKVFENIRERLERTISVEADKRRKEMQAAANE